MRTWCPLFSDRNLTGYYVVFLHGEPVQGPQCDASIRVYQDDHAPAPAQEELYKSP